MGVRHETAWRRWCAFRLRTPTWYRVHKFPYGVVPSDLDISPDGRLLSASVAEVNGDQFLRVWEIEQLLAGDVKPLSEFRFGQSVPESFVFSRDGRYLYGSSYYTGVSNIFRYEVATGAIEAVSNAETGFFRPCRSPTGGWSCWPTPRGFRSGDHRSQAVAGRQRDHVPGRRAGRRTPWSRRGRCRRPRSVDDES